MIQTESLLRVCDNSGAKLVKCIRCMGGSSRRWSRLGDEIRVSIKDLDYKKKLLRKSIYTGLIVATKKSTARLDGSFLRSDSNRCVILTKEADKFLGSRVDGPIPREIRGGEKEIKYKQIISYAGATV